MARFSQLPNRHGGLLYGEMFDWDAGVRYRGNRRRGTYVNVVGLAWEVLHHSPARQRTRSHATKPGTSIRDVDIAYKHAKYMRMSDGGSARR